MVWNSPDCVTNAVNGREIVEWFPGSGEFRLSADRVHGPVGEEYRSGIGVECQHVSSAIILFAFPCFLVLQDQIIFIVVDVHTADDPGLGTAVHDLAVGIEAVQRFPNKHSVDHQLFQVLGGAFVDLRRSRGFVPARNRCRGGRREES
jgi:hypothetical protein